MKRALTILITAAVLLGLAAVPASAYPPPVVGCEWEVSTQSDPGFWRYQPIVRIHSNGTHRIGAGCYNAVIVISRGWRYEADACGTMWVVRYRNNDSRFPYVLEGSTKQVCGGQTVTLASSQPTNARFSVLGFQKDPQDRIEGLWPVVSIQH